MLPTDKGMGSAYGGKWKPNPNKPQDMAFIGPPNTIQRLFIPTKKDAYWIQAKYGDDGWAVVIRHETTHGHGQEHTIPHDHYPIAYDPYTHAPDWYNTPEHNYFAQDVPEFKQKENFMATINWDNIDGVITNLVYDEEALRFKTISEFKDCAARGAEIVFEWKEIEYTICTRKNEQGEKQHVIAQCGSIEVNLATEMRANSLDELLEYRVSGDRLRDVITQVTVCERTF